MKRLLSILLAAALVGCGSTAQPTASAAPEATETPAAETDTAEPTQTPAETAEAEEGPVMTDNIDPLDYSDMTNWCWFKEGDSSAPADAFVIPGSVYDSPEGNIAMNEKNIRREQALVNRMKGMVGESCVIYAPAYRQATVEGMLGKDAAACKEHAYADVYNAFEYYMKNVHEEGRPIVIFGYSSGALCAQNLAADFFSGDSDEQAANRDCLVAVYAIGWGITENFYETHPNLKPASGASDTGVIISFDAEAPEVTATPILEAEGSYVAINPLNWKTDGTPADKSENLGAVLVNAKGEIKQEIPELCGAYLEDTPRHGLKVEDIDPKDFPATVPAFPEGSYHEYDIVLFYRNIEANVKDRIAAWQAQHN